ncbi:MAG TPA: DHA2 family efflux MFS transporter permease subunit [Streptosporangiaceae bacterium]|nr:DHA2 family efflux MFS transporter permease subunit [Streptosporangiaceae bacterium]
MASRQPTAPAPAAACSPAASITALTAVIVLGGFMAGLDTSLVNVGLTTIALNLHAAITNVQWVTSGYLLALAAALPAGPFLQRRIGASRLWMICLISFTAASLLCALSPDLAVLLAARVLQGAAGGLLVPTGQSIVARAVGPERMGRAMSSAGLVIVLAPAIGPALGGLLIDCLSWRWLFVVNIPIGLIAGLLAARILPKDAADRSARLDGIGLGLLSAGLPAISLGITRVSSGSSQRTSGAILIAAGVVLLGAFAVDALRAGRPAGRERLLDITLFRDARYAAAQITVFFLGLSQFGGLILLPLYYEALRGMSVVHTGLLLFAYGAGAMAALPLGGRITDRIGGGIACVLGLIVTVAATLPFVFLPGSASLLLVEVLQAIRGVGVGLSGISGMSSAMRAAPRQHLADATTTANILQRAGGSIGSAVIVLTVAHATPLLTGIRAAHGILAASATIALAAAGTLTVLERRSTHAPTAASDPAMPNRPMHRQTGEAR